MKDAGSRLSQARALVNGDLARHGLPTMHWVAASELRDLQSWFLALPDGRFAGNGRAVYPSDSFAETVVATAESARDCLAEVLRIIRPRCEVHDLRLALPRIHNEVPEWRCVDFSHTLSRIGDLQPRQP